MLTIITFISYLKYQEANKEEISNLKCRLFNSMQENESLLSAIQQNVKREIPQLNEMQTQVDYLKLDFSTICPNTTTYRCSTPTSNTIGSPRECKKMIAGNISKKYFENC